MAEIWMTLSEERQLLKKHAKFPLSGLRAEVLIPWDCGDGRAVSILLQSYGSVGLSPCLPMINTAPTIF
jgi:hypothetical protein